MAVFSNDSGNKKLELSLYDWEVWDVPEVKERLKESYYILKDYFNNV